jgi:cohesin loading factor subunit SCC2
LQSSQFQTVAETQSQLAAGIITLQQTFCQYFTHIVTTMLQHTQETAATLKSRAIKSIESFLNKDPQAMPEKSVMGVINLLRDNSPLVRADAVSLVSKCLEGNPALERHCLQSVLGLTTDPSNGPKRKAINLLKKIYLSSSSSEHKLGIIASLLLPSQDHEKAIAEIARQALEEIWLKSLDADSRIDENQLKLRRVQRASLLVQTVRRIQGQTIHLAAFENFFVDALNSKAPNCNAHLKICKELVVDMVEGVISPDVMAAGCSQEHVLATLSILTRVKPSLITQDQLQLLKLYLKNPATTDDLNILRPTVTIFRFVLPHLLNLQTDFADEVWSLLSKIIPKLASWAARGNAAGKSTLMDVVQCTWMVSPLARNGLNKLIKVISSMLVQLQPFSSATQDVAAPSESKILSWLILIGTLGKICNFDDNADLFRSSLSGSAKQFVEGKKATADQLKPLLNTTGKAPSVILLETVRPFTKQSWNLTTREHALCSVGEICQGAPGLFMRSDVEATFRVVFKNDVTSLKRVALTQFHDFFLVAEKPSDSGTTNASGDEPVGPIGRLGITFVAGDGQLTTNYLARKFLLEIVDIALKNDNELAVLAAKIITSISRQGLVHPKECGPALIALGSSSNAQISQIAAAEHKKIHDAHESMFEKEYMAAIKMAFDYQQEVYEDAHGMIASTYKPKMLHVFNVLKGGNRKTLKKFIDNLCKFMDFELVKLEEDAAGSTALLFARFCLENLALFDVPKLEDIAIITNALEDIVLKNTGPSVGVAIETELPRKVAPELQPKLEEQTHESSSEAPVSTAPPALLPTQTPGASISDVRLLQITRACMILQMMWETRWFVRKAYNLGNLAGRIPHKDFQKPALRNNLISGKELWERLELIFDSLESREAMMKRCYEFAELLELDKDAHFGDEDTDGEDPLGYVTPDEAGDETPAIPTSGRGRKRKSSGTNGNTPKKAKGRLSGGKIKKRNSKTPDMDGWD